MRIGPSLEGRRATRRYRWLQGCTSLEGDRLEGGMRGRLELWWEGAEGRTWGMTREAGGSEVRVEGRCEGGLRRSGWGRRVRSDLLLQFPLIVAVV